MARTRGIPLATQNTSADTAAKGKRPREADTLDVAVAAVAAPGKKATTAVSKSKRQRTADDAPTGEFDQVVTSEPEAPVRHSERPHIPKPAGPQKRKRRTKEEMAADKAKADAEKKLKEELTQENHRKMAQMDIDEDVDRAETAARTIRTFTELEDESSEEFIGYADIEDSESESDRGAEDALTLKVRFSS
jgi:hypothetical protein